MDAGKKKRAALFRADATFQGGGGGVEKGERRGGRTGHKAVTERREGKKRSTVRFAASFPGKKRKNSQSVA